MNRILKQLALISAALFIGFLLITLTTDVTWAQGPEGDYPPGGYGWRYRPGWMRNNPGAGRMGGWRGTEPGWQNKGQRPDLQGPTNWAPGMWGGRGYGYDPQQAVTGAVPYGYGRGPCLGMSDGWRYGYAPQGDPIDANQAVTAVEAYLTSYNNPDLAIAEVMSFSQNFYVQVKEASSDHLAFELLVDPYSGLVRPEPGPNMMWNIKYGHMTGHWSANTSTPAEMPITAEQAMQFAQAFLDTAWPGTTAADHADPFYGYYTLHILQDEKIAGMLSVNGFSGQVWHHTWHGDFIGLVDEGD